MCHIFFASKSFDVLHLSLSIHLLHFRYNLRTIWNKKKKPLFKMKNQMLLYIMHSLLLALVHLIILYKYFKNKRYFYFYCCFICLFIHNMYHKISLHLLFICFCFCDYLSLSLFVIVPSSSTYMHVLLIHLCIPSIFQCDFVNILIKPMCFFFDFFKWLLFSFKI